MFRRAFAKTSSDQELKSNNYGCLSTIIKGGKWVYQLIISVLIRLSIIPGHGVLLNYIPFLHYLIIGLVVSTTMFAACRLNFMVFLAAALISTPKLLIPVFAGEKLQEANEDRSK